MMIPKRRQAERSPTSRKPKVILPPARPYKPGGPKAAAIFAAVREELLRVDTKTGRVQFLQPKPGGRLSRELVTDKVVVPASGPRTTARRSRATRARKRTQR